ncbi:hypothetical protein GCM10027068_44850 [Prescottella soli]
MPSAAAWGADISRSVSPESAADEVVIDVVEAVGSDSALVQPARASAATATDDMARVRRDR